MERTTGSSAAGTKLERVQEPVRHVQEESFTMNRGEKRRKKKKNMRTIVNNEDMKFDPMRPAGLLANNQPNSNSNSENT